MTSILCRFCCPWKRWAYGCEVGGEPWWSFIGDFHVDSSMVGFVSKRPTGHFFQICAGSFGVLWVETGGVAMFGTLRMHVWTVSDVVTVLFCFLVKILWIWCTLLYFGRVYIHIRSQSLLAANFLKPSFAPKHCSLGIVFETRQMETSTCTLWRMGSPNLVLAEVLVPGYSGRFGDRAAHHPGEPSQEIATFIHLYGC